MTLTARSLDSKVKYRNPSKVLSFNNTDKQIEKDLSFIEENILKEVKKQTFDKKKIFSRTLVVTQLTLLLISTLSNPVSAMETITTSGTLMSELPTPDEVNKFTQWAISTVTNLAYATGAVTGVGACILYFHPNPAKAKKAMEMLANVIKGTTQLMLFPTVMAIIILTAKYFLGDLPFFHLNF